MSRYEIHGFNPKHEIIVGWDRPLNTFFGQVFDLTLDEEQNPIKWYGSAGNFPEVHDLVRVLAPYTDIPISVIASMVQDQERDL